MEHLDRQVRVSERELPELGAEHEYVPLVMSAPGSRGCSVMIAAVQPDRRNLPAPVAIPPIFDRSRVWLRPR
jgi:hypothetical protein